MAYLKWRELSRVEIEQLDKQNTVVLVPVGSMEQHGPHLPVSCDTLITEAVLDGLAARAGDLQVLATPTLWFSKSDEHRGFAGTLYLRRETFARQLLELSESIALSGFRKLVFLNGHGGNTQIISLMLRDIREHTGMMTFLIYLGTFYGNYIKLHHLDEWDIHAGYLETSLLLHSYPELMRGRVLPGEGGGKPGEKLLKTFEGYQYLQPEGGEVSVGWNTIDYTDDGVIGNASLANPQTGKDYLDCSITETLAALREISRFNFIEA